MPAASLLGLDVGGTKCAVVTGTPAGEVCARAEWLSQAERGPEPMLADLLREARALLARDPGVRSVGVSIGGPLDSDRGIILSPPNLPGWDRIPLKARLEQELKLPVSVEHDAAACALAEYLWGAGQGARRLTYLTCGTGFGCGFIFDGRIYRGAGGLNCEVGHIALRPVGPVAFGKAGSAEAICSGHGLSRLAAWHFPERWLAARPSGAELAEWARGGDLDAREVLRLNAEAVGDVCALLADTLRLDLILLGSLGRYLGEEWLGQVRRQFARQAHSTSQALCRIAVAGLGARLQDCSALAAACAVRDDTRP